jgi:hypothetical protein
MRESRGTLYSHYEQWEDWHNGLYGSLLREDRIGDSMELLSNPPLFADVLWNVREEWPRATAQHLSNRDKNHRPWCGRLACNYEHGATIPEVNAAWSELTYAERIEADEVADYFTELWRSRTLFGQIGLPL